MYRHARFIDNKLKLLLNRSWC